MFTADDSQRCLRDRPFQPFRVVTTTGQTYDVYHPDLVMIGRHFLMIGMPRAENPTQAEQVTRVANLHVTELQDLPTPSAPSNGPPS